MDNHYHLLLQTREANLSRAMQWLNVSYTVWFEDKPLRKRVAWPPNDCDSAESQRAMFNGYI